MLDLGSFGQVARQVLTALCLVLQCPKLRVRPVHVLRTAFQFYILIRRVHTFLGPQNKTFISDSGFIGSIYRRGWLK